MEHDYQQIMVVLSAALGLSFIIERFLQVLKTLFDRVLFRADALTPPETMYTERVVEGIEKRHQEDEQDSLAEELEVLRAQLVEQGAELPQAERENILKRIAELESKNVDTNRMELAEESSEATAFVDVEALPDRLKVMRTFWLQVLGTFGGVVVCSVTHFGLFTRLTEGSLAIPLVLDYVLTGILIGAGSQPMHFLVEFITKRKVTTLRTAGPSEEEMPEERAEPEPASLVSVPAAQPVVQSHIDVPYRGGVDRDLLEHIHRRPSDPNLIVYHHTAMHSDTTFADVVKAIKDKGWTTGYHCVVLKSGSIHPFCRWDRYGNHAKGHNLTSLGIAFNGNFETNPSDPWANFDGRYGLVTPTEIQLRAAARVVALWTYLYKIPLEFGTKIVPHKSIRDTACPGSNFPFGQFEQLIRFYRQKWSDTPEAKEEIEVFKKKPYLYV